MSEPFVGEIRMFAGNFAPRGWAFCDGQLLPISQYDALFSLLGTAYGGDGRTTFGLPDMRGRIPVHAGHGHRLGQRAGVESVTLTANQIPTHTHVMRGSTSGLLGIEPAGSFLGSTSGDLYTADETPDTNMANESISAVGGSQSHSNMMPYLCIHFIIALFGIYPSRH
ncbi:MAG: phage tail protein [Chloroflexi bacterium]|nr:MAG: phage tail protein [Chloroflexota bacterium]